MVSQGAVVRWSRIVARPQRLPPNSRVTPEAFARTDYVELDNLARASKGPAGFVERLHSVV